MSEHKEATYVLQEETLHVLQESVTIAVAQGKLKAEKKAIYFRSGQFIAEKKYFKNWKMILFSKQLLGVALIKETKSGYSNALFN